MRRFIGSAIVMLSVAAIASGGEYFGSVSKFGDGKITFKAIDIANKGLGDEKTVKVADNVKIKKGTFDKGAGGIAAGEDYTGGKEAFAKAVKDAGEKKPDETKKGKGGFGGLGGGGVLAQVITEGDGDSEKVTEIRVLDFGGFGGKKKKGG